jgi:hypothetical protein
MKNLHILPLGCLLLPAAFVGGNLQAQDLNKEITIDRDIVPAQRAAARPVVFPNLTAPTAANVNLNMEEGTPSQLSTDLTLFAPAATPAAFEATPYRGYLDLGYFPAINLGVSAGYAIVDKSATKLNVWLQANNRNYKGLKQPSSLADENEKWKSLDLAGGFDFAQRFGKYNVLRLSTDVAYGNWNIVDRYISLGDAQRYIYNPYDKLNNFRWHFNGGFDGRANENLTYGIGAAFGLFHNKDVDKDMIGYVGTPAKAVNQSQITFDGYVREQVSDHASVGIKVEGDFLHSNSFYTPDRYIDMDNGVAAKADALSGKTLGHVDFVPSVDYNTGSFYGKVGVRLQLSANSGKSFHIAPDLTLGVNPDARFGAWLKFGGGVQTNSAESLYLVNRYADTKFAYELSNLAFTGQLGLRVGPFYGASLTLTADYAAANDWLMPYQYLQSSCATNLFRGSDLRSWKVGARIDWEYRKLLKVGLSYEGALGSDEKDSWIYWSDRARHVLGASVSVTPISALTVDLGISARLNRYYSLLLAAERIYINDQDYTETTTPTYYKQDLGDLTNFWAGASYKITPAFTVFARFDNILNKRTQMVFATPNQGFTGLFGIGYKF